MFYELFRELFLILEPEKIRVAASYFVKFTVRSVKQLSITAVHADAVRDFLDARKCCELFFTPRRYIDRGKLLDFFLRNFHV